MLSDVQIIGLNARVQWYFWEYEFNCAGGFYELAFQEGCGSLEPSSNDTTSFVCSLPCYEGTAPIWELEVESDKSYSFFLRVQCNLRTDYYSYYNNDVTFVTTNYSAPLCVQGNSSLIGTPPPFLGTSSALLGFIPPFRECFANPLFNVSVFPNCYFDERNRTVYTTYDFGLFITDLQPSTSYAFHVQGYCNGMWIDSEPVCNRTYSVPLEVVGTSTTTTTATVYWKAYEGMEYECPAVTFYTVTISTDYNSYVSLTSETVPPISVTVPANSTMVTVENLEENTEYIAFLTAYCGYGLGSIVLGEPLLVVSTFESLIKIGDVIPGVYDAYITWTVPPCTEPTYEVLAQVGCFSKGGTGDVTQRSNKNYTTISSLLSYTYYDFSVIAHCNATYQLQSHSVCARTNSAPPTITNVSATVSTLSFTWNISTCPSFLYEINITRGCETTPDSNVEVYNVFNFTITAQQPMHGADGQNASSTGTDSSLYSTSIFSLQPGTAYGIKVRSFCTAGSEITGYSDVVCAMTAEPDIECNSSVAFFALSQNSGSQPVSNQLVAAIYDPISNGNTYFGVDPEDQLFLLKVNVLGSRGLLPFGTDYGGLEYEFSYSSSSYYGLQYTLPKPLPFFGKDQSILYVNARGFISIGEPYLNPWSLIPFPLTGEVPMVAAFWWWYYTKVYVHSYQQGSGAFDDAVIEVVGDRLRGFDMVNSSFQPETMVSITWSQVSVA